MDYKHVCLSFLKESNSVFPPFTLFPQFLRKYSFYQIFEYFMHAMHFDHIRACCLPNSFQIHPYFLSFLPASCPLFFLIIIQSPVCAAHIPMRVRHFFYFSYLGLPPSLKKINFPSQRIQNSMEGAQCTPGHSLSSSKLPMHWYIYPMPIFRRQSRPWLSHGFCVFVFCTLLK